MPALNPVAIELVPPDGDHEYVYGDVPPLTEIEAVPLLPPLQLTLPGTNEALIADGCVTTVLPATVQPLASVTVMV